MFEKIGILTGGGDAPGLNAVIRAAVRTAIRQFQMEVVGIEDGYEGLLGDMQMRNLTTSEVAGLLPRGGTILGTRNSGHFCYHTPDGKMHYPQEPVIEAIENMRRVGIEALVAMGGEGTLGIAEQFNRRDFPVIGVPKTIDNDLACTELTFGFQTACDIATEALDRLHTTAESHDRVMILEVMGRNAGWIALHSGLAGSADVILIPEIPFVMSRVIEKVRAREAGGARFTIIVVAEGATEIGGEARYVDAGSADKAKRLGGMGEYIRQRIEEETEKESRVVVLGHLQRGGTPNAFDRMLATNFGACAVRALAEGQRGVMVALQSASIITVPLAQAITNIKSVAADGQLVRTARDIGISFAAPDEPQFMRQ
ncbi:MAG: 6-phosphofructokinase [Acidobacteriota bacterium]|nr:6-phosphofructokinase [Acidobacteriota bacterium]